VISSFRRSVNEVFAFLGCCAVLTDNDVSGQRDYTETSATDYQSELRNIIVRAVGYSSTSVVFPSFCQQFYGSTLVSH
jgi:hypothetical protein